jgi:hypothetical protein
VFSQRDSDLPSACINCNFRAHFARGDPDLQTNTKARTRNYPLGILRRPKFRDSIPYVFRTLNEVFPEIVINFSLKNRLRRDADKFLAFPVLYLQHNQKNFSWTG